MVWAPSESLFDILGVLNSSFYWLFPLGQESPAPGMQNGTGLKAACAYAYQGSPTFVMCTGSLT